MLETIEYLLLGALIFTALALISDLVFVTSKSYAVRKQPAARTRTRTPVTVGGPASGDGVADDAGVTANDVDERREARQSASSRSLSWYGTAFAVVSFLLVTAYLIARMSLTGHGPFANQHEFAVSFIWGIALASLYFQWRYRVRMLSLIVYPVIIAMMVYALSLDTGIDPLVPALQNNLMLTLHVGFAVFAYGAACVSFGGAVLFLLHDSISKKIRRMPSKDLLDEIGYKAAVITFPALTIMILLGAVWADTAWGRYWGWDPKETAAFVTWLLYGAYLHARVVRDWRGKKAAWLLIIGFASVLFAYFGNHFFGGLHSYG